MQVRCAPSRNIVLHGLEATGKSAIIKALLEELSTKPDQSTDTLDDLRYAIVKCAECISGRHLLEQTIGAVARAVDFKGNIGRCENLPQLVVEVGRLLESRATSAEEDAGRHRLTLVFDGIDHQRDGPPTLLPALVRLGEIVSKEGSIHVQY
jgi:origin recognition complex subunit 5